MFTVLSEQRLRPFCASLAATYSQLYVQPLAQIPYFLSFSPLQPLGVSIIERVRLTCDSMNCFDLVLFFSMLGGHPFL